MRAPNSRYAGTGFAGLPSERRGNRFRRASISAPSIASGRLSSLKYAATTQASIDSAGSVTTTCRGTRFDGAPTAATRPMFAVLVVLTRSWGHRRDGPSPRAGSSARHPVLFRLRRDPPRRAAPVCGLLGCAPRRKAAPAGLAAGARRERQEDPSRLLLPEPLAPISTFTRPNSTTTDFSDLKSATSRRDSRGADLAAPRAAPLLLPWPTTASV